MCKGVKKLNYTYNNIDQLLHIILYYISKPVSNLIEHVNFIDNLNEKISTIFLNNKKILEHLKEIKYLTFGRNFNGDISSLSILTSNSTKLRN